ncbi:MAG TPA: hypothetical protein VKY65_07945 [Alphaproteobacteria bacterium]|nr:hypothetical protein [Alphaproteobacteria bacterium]
MRRLWVLLIPFLLVACQSNMPRGQESVAAVSPRATGPVSITVPQDLSSLGLTKGVPNPVGPAAIDAIQGSLHHPSAETESDLALCRSAVQQGMSCTVSY